MVPGELAPVVADPADVDALVQLDRSAFPFESLSRPTWEREVEKGNVLILGRPVVGFLLTQDEEGSRSIARLGVAATHRSQGYGTRLLRQGLLDVEVAQLTVSQSNRRAIALYERLGFSIVDQLPSQGGSGHYSMQWRAA